MNNIINIKSDDKRFLEKIQSIYCNSFPEWEREDFSKIKESLTNKKSNILGILKNKRVIGFSIIEFYSPLKFQFLAYLAVEEIERGKGYGTQICSFMVKKFLKENICTGSLSYFILEAEKEQSLFYKKFGFKKIGIEYLVPCYDGSGTVPMNLMILFALEKKYWPQFIKGKEIYSIIRSILINGYFLSETDIRLVNQLNKINEKIKILDDW